MKEYSNKNEYNKSFMYYAATMVFLLYIVSAIFIRRSYYADGTEFLRILISRKTQYFPFANDPSVLRIGVNALNQLPVVLAIKLGVNNIKILQVLFSITLFTNEIVGLCLCYRIMDNKKYIVFPLINYTFFEIISEIFILNQSYTASWIYWIIFFYLIRKKKITKISDYLILLVCFLVMPFSHETVMPVGVLMLLIGIVEVLLLKHRENLICKSFIMFDALLAVLIGVYYISTHQSATSESYFSLIFDLIKSGCILQMNIMISLGMGLVMCIFIFIAMPKWIDYVLATLGILFTLWIFVRNINYPLHEYYLRSFVTFGTFGVVVIAYLYYAFETRISDKINLSNAFRITLVTLLIQSFWQLGNNIGWYQYLNAFNNQMDNSEGYIEDTVVGKYSWPWTSPGLSLLEAEKRDEINKLVLPIYSGYEVELTNNGLIIPFIGVNKEDFNYEPLLEYGHLKALSMNDFIQKNVNVELKNQDQIVVGVPENIELVIKTDGDNYWNKERICFSYHVYNMAGECIVNEAIRTEFNLLSDEKIVPLVINPNDFSDKGQYYIRLDVVKENELWLSDAGIYLPYIEIINQ